MTIRFSPARDRNAVVRAVTRVRAKPTLMDAANDDGDQANDETLLGEALLHFALHGLGAAERARDLAVDAGRTGDHEARDHWLSVCRMFDRRMARAFAAESDIGKV